jgi:glutamyl-tRNA reductase
MITLFCFEVNHQNAPLKIRERISFSAEELTQIYRDWKTEFDQFFILSTCNRTSIYFAGKEENAKGFFEKYAIPDRFIQSFANEFAITHLFETACGLHSAIVGESEILGQIKTQFESAMKADVLGKELKEIIRRSIAVGKRVRTETAIGEQAASYAGITYHLIKKNFPEYQPKILVFGTGELAVTLLKIFSKHKLNRVSVFSRNEERLQHAAAEFGAHQLPESNIPEAISNTDVIIGATNHTAHRFSEVHILHETDKKQLIIDLGVPRNFLFKKKMKNRIVVTGDDFEKIASENLQMRQHCIHGVYAIIDDEKNEAMNWLEKRKHQPALQQFNQHVEYIKTEELEKIYNKLPLLTEHERKQLEEFATRLSKRIASFPIKEIIREKS